MVNEHEGQEKIESGMLQSIENPFCIVRSQMSFSQWAGHIKDIGDELQVTIKETEKEFLTIGSSLKEFYKRSENISGMSSQIAQVLSGEEISSTIQRLNNLVTQMNDTMAHAKDETGRRIEKLKYLINVIININGLLEEMTVSVKSLKMLGMTARIYSNNSSNYNFLAADVKRLAADMNSKTVSMTDGLKSLRMKIGETLSKVLDLGEIQQNKARQILENTLSSLSSLIEKHTSSKTIAKNISILSENTSKSIAEVVKFLQFHDIIYQHINQIKESFYSLHDRLEIAGYEENHGKAETVMLISETGLICDYQSGQLCQFRDKMTSAVNNIIENLHAINTNVKEICRETRELAGDTEEKKQSFFSETKKGLSVITSAISMLAENAKISKDLSKAISSIVLDEIPLFLKDIGLIQDEMELIALNATVKAANMEKGGEALNVISESLHKLALEVRGRTGSILDVFKSMKSVTEELTAGIDSEKEKDAQVYEMAAEFDLLTNLFHRINTDIASLLASIDSEGRKLSEDIDLSIKGICVNEMFSRISNRAIAEMKRVASVSYSLVPVMDNSLKENIMMRMTEEQFLGTGQTRVSEKYTDSLSADKDKSSEDHFEDNIELF